MANGYNKVILIGNLGDEPQMRTAANGTTIANFSLAINEFRRNPQTGENSDYTEWVRCVAFGRTAETIGRYLHKGSQVHVEGKIRTSSYEKDGQRRYSTEVVLDPSGLIMLGSRQQNQDNYYNGNRQNYGQRNDGETYGSSFNSNGYNQNSNYNRSMSQSYNRNPQRQNYNSQSYGGYANSPSPYGSAYNSANSYDNSVSSNSYASANSYAQANSANHYPSQNKAYSAANTEKDTEDSFNNAETENTVSAAPVAEKASDLKEPVIPSNNDDDLPF